MVRQVKLPRGELKRVSVSLLVDQDVRWEGRAPHLQLVLIPPSADKLKTIRDLVAGVIGFKTERGDQLIVETLPFEATLHTEPPAPAVPAGSPAAPADRVPAWLRTPKGMGAAAGGAVLLLVLVVVGFRRLLRRPAGSAETRMALAAGAGSVPALAGGHATEQKMQAQLTDQTDTQMRLEAEALAAIKAPSPTTNKKDVLSKYLREGLKKDSVVQVQTLRTWLHEKA